MKLNELPEELLESIILHLDVRSIAALTKTCRLMNRIANSEWVWHHRTLADFNLPATIHQFRSKGWKRLYRGLADPILLTWGSPDNNRLGRDLFFPERYNDEHVPAPVELRNVIQVACGGWSIHALTRQGQVWSSGTLDGSWGDNQGMHLVSGLASHHIVSISAGRGHVMALSKNGDVFYWCRKDKIRKLEGLQPHSVAQIVGGWTHCVALLKNNSIIIWNPKQNHRVSNNVNSLDKYVMVAAGAEFTIALRDTGEIVWFDMDGVPIRSFHDHVYTHITASHQMFAGFTINGTVSVFHADGTPNPQPALQNKGVCQMSFGDWHYGMLTESGEIWTWGQYSQGALGHDEGTAPQIVPLDKFVFQISFAGWHCAALAIDLQ